MGMKNDPGEEAQQQSFLQRWSRRKLDAERESGYEPAADSDDGADAQAEDAQAEDVPAPEETPLSDADMPPLETLDQDSDFSLFMSAGVSEALRRKALRKLFHGPKFNVRDGLCDYDDDYSGLSPLGDVVTAEMRRARERLEEQAQRKAAQWLDEPPGEVSLAKNEDAAQRSDTPWRDPDADT